MSCYRYLHISIFRRIKFPQKYFQLFFDARRAYVVWCDVNRVIRLEKERQICRSKLSFFTDKQPVNVGCFCVGRRDSVLIANHVTTLIMH